MLHVASVHRVLPSDLLGEVPPCGPVDRPVGNFGTVTGRRHAHQYSARGRNPDCPATSALACCELPVELKSVYKTWAQDWVTSVMGGAGGTGIFERDGAIFLGYQSLGRDWDVKLEWEGARWKVTAQDHAESNDSLDEFNAAELPLAEAFMAGLYFDSPG